MKAYEEQVEFMSAGPGPRKLATFQASAETKARVAELIREEKTTGLTAEEKAELDNHMQLEHLMRLVRACAHQRMAHESTRQRSVA